MLQAVGLQRVGHNLVMNNNLLMLGECCTLLSNGGGFIDA